MIGISVIKELTLQLYLCFKENMADSLNNEMKAIKINYIVSQNLLKYVQS